MIQTVLYLYIFCLLLLFFYALEQMGLLFAFRRRMRKGEMKTPVVSQPWPKVLVQLPVYNEKYVIERLLDSICALDYPREALEIQLLDDGNDESVDIAAKKIQELKQQGFSIHHIQRTDRAGFKAGALKYGMTLSSAEYIAIFDADFLPPSSFLKQTIPYFQQEKVGIVQTKWGHINRDFSLLTKAQAFALDIHFTIEQIGRNASGKFINFNGTAGVWRTECILDAGNWSGSTITEDLDLSFRAQLRGWKAIYLPHVVSPAELPISISATKSQQYRWNKGGAENLLQLFTTILPSKNTSAHAKTHALIHLFNSSFFLIIFILSISSLVISHRFEETQSYGYLMTIVQVFTINTLLLSVLYYASYRYNRPQKHLGHFFLELINFLSIILGFTFHNSIAVVQAYFRKKTPFVRTPKFNILKEKHPSNTVIQKNSYSILQFSWRNGVELLLLILFVFYTFSDFVHMRLGLGVFHAMISFGYMYILIQTWKEKFQQNVT